MKTPTDLALAALNGFKWLGNNLHNIRSLPDQFESFYKAALDDAEKAIAALSSAQDPIAPGHNPDQLTVSQVGDGWRLLDRDEIKERDGLKMEIENWMTRRWDNSGWVGNFASNTYRTRLTHEELMALDKPQPKWQLPAPPAGQRWHREDFTEADLPEGWRPLLMGESVQRGDVSICGSHLHVFEHEVGAAHPDDSLLRTMRPLPSAPKAEPWDSPEDVPGPVCWMRETDISCARMVIALPYAGVVVGCTGEGKLVRWDELSQWQHSTNRINWKPCTKEAKA